MRRKKPEVLVIGGLPPPTGGMETVMEQMAAMHLKNANLTIMNVAKTRLIKSNIIFNTANFAYRCLKLAALLATRRIDIVHVHIATGYGYWQRMVFGEIAKLMGKKTIFHAHGADFKEFYGNSPAWQKQIIRQTLKRADCIVVLSPSWKEFYRKIAGNSRIVVIPNAVDIPFGFHQQYSRANDSNHPFRILFLSRICKRKGVYDLLKALSRLKKKKVAFNALFVGPFENEKEFRQKVSESGLADNCQIIGEVMGNKRYAYYLKADAFVLPSYAEGLPVAILEAMHFSLPIVSTNVGAIPELVGKENGILTGPGDAAQLEKALIGLSRDGNTRKKMGMANKKLVMTAYSMGRFRSNLEKLYTQIR